MATAHIKKVIRLGGSLAIVLPSQWARGRVKAGEEMVVIGNGELRIFPVHLNDSQIQEGKSQDNGTSQL